MSIFKDTFKPFVINQIKTRQDVRVDRRNDPNIINYLNSKTAWIKLSSSVNIEPNSDLARMLKTSGDQLAKKYILQGGTLYEKANQDGKKELFLRRGIGSGGGAYGDKTLGGPNENWKQGGREELGIRPMPGITSVSIKSKSAYGSLREATVSFSCWSMSQLEELEVLYMRPGYTVLLEWGWSMYLDNKGKLNNNSPQSINLFEAQKSNLTKNVIFKKIFNRVEESNCNQDAMYGYVKNFQWNARPDGGYDCSIDVISIGEVLESLKINYSTTESAKNFVLANTDKISDQEIEVNGKKTTVRQRVIDVYKQNKLAGILMWVQERYSKGGFKEGTVDVNFTNNKNETYSTQVLKYTLNFKESQSSPNSNITSPQIYIPIKLLAFFLNEYIIINDIKNDEPLIKMSLNDDDGEPLECFAFWRQTSVDPKICLISPYKKLLNEKGEPIGSNFIYNILKKENQYFKNENRGTIGNIYLNVSYLIEVLNSLSTKSENKSVDLYTFLKTIMSDVQESTGNINLFDIQIDSNSDLFRIIDVQYLEDRKRRLNIENTALIEVFGTKTFVRNYSLGSSIFPSQVTMIAISAQVGGAALGYNNSTFIEFNRGLVDRIIPIKDEKTSNNYNENDREEQIKQSKLKAVNDFIENRRSLTEFFIQFEKKEVLTGRIEDLKIALHDSIYFEINSSEEEIKSRYKGIMPIKLTLTMDGISGITIGQIFSIPEDRLPSGYKSSGGFKVGFIVTGISNELQGNDWTTILETQTCILQ